MVVELLRTRGCIDYTGIEPKIPTLNVTVHDPVSGAKSQILAAVDTGFGGYLLVRKELYEQLATAELPAEAFMTYSSMAGPVVLRRARATIETGKLTLHAYIETPQHGPGKDLIGRRILHEINIALFGKAEKCCLVEGA